MTGSRFNLPYVKPVNGVGVPYPFARLWFYESETDTPQDTFSNEGLTIANSNPVVADANGLFPSIFLGPNPYKVKLYSAPYPDGDNTLIWTADPVRADLVANEAAGTFCPVATFDGAGSAVTAPAYFDFIIPFPFQITANVIQSVIDGDATFDLWANEFDPNNPPTIADTIVASAPPTLSAAQGALDETLTGWTKSFAFERTWIRVKLTSAATTNHVQLSLIIEAT